MANVQMGASLFCGWKHYDISFLEPWGEALLMMMIQALQHKDEKQVVIIGVYKCGQVNKQDRCIYVSV